MRAGVVNCPCRMRPNSCKLNLAPFRSVEHRGVSPVVAAPAGAASDAACAASADLDGTHG